MTPHPNRRFGFIWLWVLVPLVFTLWLSWKWTPNFPHADHWGLESGLLLDDAAGRVGWQTFAGQMNDSRYALPRLIHLQLAKATQWNLQIEAALCVLMGGGIAILAWWICRRTLTGRAADWTAALLSLLILSPHQSMNWNFGVQVCYLLTVGTALGTAAVFLTKWNLVRQTAAGIFLATLGCWSFAPGWLGWGLVIWGILGWARRTRLAAIVIALAATLAAMALNLVLYFRDYQFQEGIPLTQKLTQQWPAITHYFFNMMGAPFAEGWLRNNNAGRARMQDNLGPALSAVLLLWLGFLAVLHRRDLLRRTGSAPAWIWSGLAGWALLLVGLVSLARTGNVLSNAFASRYLAFSIWAWAAALILTQLLAPGRLRRILTGTGLLIFLWGYASGMLTGIRQMQKEGYTMRLLQGSLTMSSVAPEPLGLRGNTPEMHAMLPAVQRLDELGYIHPPLVRSPLVSDATIAENPFIEGNLVEITRDPLLKITGFAIDHRRGGPADCVVLSFQPDGGEEIWWTPITGRSLQPFKQFATQRGLTGEHARIGWVWESGQDPLNYQVVTPPARPCIIRAYALDGRTGIFYRLNGEMPLPPAP
jgi:hypothetical protein